MSEGYIGDENLKATETFIVNRKTKEREALFLLGELAQRSATRPHIYDGFCWLRDALASHKMFLDKWGHLQHRRYSRNTLVSCSEYRKNINKHPLQYILHLSSSNAIGWPIGLKH